MIDVTAQIYLPDWIKKKTSKQLQKNNDVLIVQLALFSHAKSNSAWDIYLLSELLSDHDIICTNVNTICSFRIYLKSPFFGLAPIEVFDEI